MQRFLAKRPEPLGKVCPLRVPHLAGLPDLLREDLGGPEQLRPQLLVERLRPRGRPSTSRPSSRACASGPAPHFTVDFLLEYDVNFLQFRRRSVEPGGSTDRGARCSSAGRKSSRLAEERGGPADRGQHPPRQRDAAARAEPALALDANGYYDFVNKVLYTIQGASALRRAVLRLQRRVHPLRLQRPRRSGSSASASTSRTWAPSATSTASTPWAASRGSGFTGEGPRHRRGGLRGRATSWTSCARSIRTWSSWASCVPTAARRAAAPASRRSSRRT